MGLKNNAKAKPFDNKVIVKVIKDSENIQLPEYETEFAAGMDLRAYIPEAIELNPLQRVLVPTGLKIELPVGYEAQIRPRSGLSLKKGIMAILGTIDADYRGGVGIILINLSNETFTINPGERLAQMVVAPVSRVEWDNDVLFLSETERGEGGFGSTGRK